MSKVLKMLRCVIKVWFLPIFCFWLSLFETLRLVLPKNWNIYSKYRYYIVWTVNDVLGNIYPVLLPKGIYYISTKTKKNDYQIKVSIPSHSMMLWDLLFKPKFIYSGSWDLKSLSNGLNFFIYKLICSTEKKLLSISRL